MFLQLQLFCSIFDKNNSYEVTVLFELFDFKCCKSFLLAIQAVEDFGIERLVLVLYDSACIDKLGQSIDFPRFVTDRI